jgi:Tol biopolymer transport system component
VSSAALVLASAAAAGPVKSNGLISFGVCCEKDPGIYTINPDGSGQRRIFKTDSTVLYTAWSPSGARIAYVRPDGVWTMSPTGSGRKRVAKGKGETYEATWSPSGKQIAFSDRYKKGKSALYIVSSRGGTPKSIYTAANYLTDAAWSPSDKLIAFSRDSATIWMVRPDGKGLKKIGAGSHPSWSPDSKRIAFTRGGNLWVMNANGTRAKRVVAVPNSANATAWSPDASWIAYGGGERGDLRVVHPNGTGDHELTHQSSQFNSWPAWQPKP